MGCPQTGRHMYMEQPNNLKTDAMLQYANE